MKQASLKRKRKSIVPNEASQFKITKYLKISSSTPINQEEIEINSAAAPRETIGSQLIRGNLSKLLSKDLDSSTEPQRSKENDKCRESDVITEVEKDFVDYHDKKYWQEKAKYWEEQANTYKEQFDFTNKLLNRKLRQIELMKKEINEKPVSNTDSSRNLLFRNFEKSFSQDAMFKIRSVQPGRQNDRKFVKFCLQGIYEDQNEVLLERTPVPIYVPWRRVRQWPQGPRAQRAPVQEINSDKLEKG